METVAHDGRETAYRRTDFGDGQPVVYVHGSGGTHRLWVEQYGPDGVGPAVAVDLSGHGESDDVDAGAGYETLNAYVDDVCAVARGVWTSSDGPDRASGPGAGDGATGPRVIAGNSMGGAVAMWTALERDLDLDALVLCGTGAKLGVADELLAALADDFPAALDALDEPDALFHDAPEDVRERTRAVMADCGQRITERDFRTCDAFDVRDRLDEIDVPCLAVTGEHDGLTPPRFHEYLGEHLPACEVAILDDAAHLSMLARPDAWNDAVRAFVSGRR